MKVGIVGNGNIVKVACDALRTLNIEMPALYCRNAERGKPVADAYGIANVYTDYDAFLKDDSFDTIYIGLVNAMHYPYAFKAVEAGKHVIVEKPFTLTYAEAQDLWRGAQENGVYLFEAILSRYNPYYEKMMIYLDQIGDLKMVRSTYCQRSSRYDAYLKKEALPAFDPAMGGGALYDINIYNIHFVTGLFGIPKFSYYMANQGWNEIDTSGVLIMDYGNFKAELTGAKDCNAPSGTILQGDHGYLRIDSRPGVIKNIYLCIDGSEEKRIDTQEIKHPFVQEFERIQEVIENKEDATVYRWMNATLQTMLIAENARRDIDLVFPTDLEEAGE